VNENPPFFSSEKKKKKKFAFFLARRRRGKTQMQMPIKIREAETFLETELALSWIERLDRHEE